MPSTGISLHWCHTTSTPSTLEHTSTTLSFYPVLTPEYNGTRAPPAPTSSLWTDCEERKSTAPSVNRPKSNTRPKVTLEVTPRSRDIASPPVGSARISHLRDARAPCRWLS
eukprot:1637984-Rhodomonas_salina.1